MHEERKPRILIVGAGIGGLSAANALQHSGHDVTVFEKAAELKEMGAGIVLAANAMKALDKLGLGEQVRSAGSPVKKAEIRTWDGKILVDMPVHDQAKKYGTYSYLIYRPDLQRILQEKVKPGTVVFNKKYARLEQNKEKIVSFFEDGEFAEGDFLIGADGVHSKVKKSLFGSSPLRYSGFTAFRGIAHFEDGRLPIELGSGFEAWGYGKRFGFSHLGQGRMFWYAAINAQLGTLINVQEKKQSAMEHFKGWWEPVQEVINSTEESNILLHEIFDRKPVKKWSQGRVTLLGDAAHPMQPNLGQGGAQAIEDALVLSRSLHSHPDHVQHACKIYEELRLPRTTRIVKGSRMMARFMQLENPLAIEGRNLLLRAIPGSFQTKRLEWIIGHEL
jgi:2-polyprenyl-6-methoxyphenol hydroxylase-like FAD-dependent oxidoreductase